MFAIEHPSDKTLSSLWSEDLPAAATESILAHLESCVECEQRLAGIDSSIEQYRRIVSLVDSHLPPPPRVWADIWTEMERVDRSLRPVTMRPAKAYQGRPIWIVAIAAAILLALLIWPRGGSVARAETLLTRAKASADRAHSRKRSHLRVVTRQASFVRPAVLASDAPGNDLLRAQFLTARYDWSDPLSAAAFRGWREQLRQKTDHVSESGEPVQYRVETTTHGQRRARRIHRLRGTRPDTSQPAARIRRRGMGRDYGPSRDPGSGVGFARSRACENSGHAGAACYGSTTRGARTGCPAGDRCTLERHAGTRERGGRARREHHRHALPFVAGTGTPVERESVWKRRSAS